MSLDLADAHYLSVRQHFDTIASEYTRFKKLNSYYHAQIQRWLRSVLPEGLDVIELGCGRSDMLLACQPRSGVGVDLSPRMIAQNQAQGQDLKFICGRLEDIEITETFDAALLINTLEYAYDVNQVFKKTKEFLRDNGRIYIATGNPIWAGIFKFASRMGWRQPDCQRLFLTNLDIDNLLKMNDFEVCYRRMGLVLPKKIPLLSGFMNWILPRIPALNLLCSTQFIVARKISRQKKDYSVSIIIPCHNESGNIERCIETVPRLGKSTELIFVDDGSTDKTTEEIEKFKNRRADLQIRLISYQPNGGKGHAVKRGFDAATGDITLILDADLTTDSDELGEVYRFLSEGRAEFVNCTRMIYPMQSGAMRLSNYIGNKLFTILVSWVMETRVSDTLCGTKACFRKDYRYFLMGRDPWGDYDFLFGAAQLRLAIAELPVHYRERIAGTSKMRAFKHTLNLLKMCGKGFFQIKFQKPILVRNQTAK